MLVNNLLSIDPAIIENLNKIADTIANIQITDNDELKKLVISKLKNHVKANPSYADFVDILLCFMQIDFQQSKKKNENSRNTTSNMFSQNVSNRDIDKINDMLEHDLKLQLLIAMGASSNAKYSEIVVGIFKEMLDNPEQASYATIMLNKIAEKKEDNERSDACACRIL